MIKELLMRECTSAQQTLIVIEIGQEENHF